MWQWFPEVQLFVTLLTLHFSVSLLRMHAHIYIHACRHTCIHTHIHRFQQDLDFTYAKEGATPSVWWGSSRVLGKPPPSPPSSENPFLHLPQDPAPPVQIHPLVAHPASPESSGRSSALKSSHLDQMRGHWCPLLCDNCTMRVPHEHVGGCISGGRKVEILQYRGQQSRLYQPDNFPLQLTCNHLHSCSHDNSQ